MALEIEVAAQEALRQLTAINNQFEKMIEAQSPLVVAIGRLDKTLKSIDGKLESVGKSMQSAALATEALTKHQNSAAKSTEAISKHLKTERDALEGTTKALKESEAATGRLAKIKEMVLTASQKQAKVEKELKGYLDQGKLTAVEYGRAMELLRVSQTKVGTEVERHIAKLREQREALNNNKRSVLESMSGWKLLSEGQQKNAMSLQAQLDAYKLLEPTLKRTSSAYDEHIKKVQALNLLRDKGLLGKDRATAERNYAQAMKELTAELDRNALAEKKRKEQLEKLRDPDLHSLRERIAKLKEQNTLIPKNTELLLRQDEAFKRLSKSEQQQAVWAAKVSDAQKLLNTEFNRAQQPLDKYKAKLHALTVAQRQYAMTGGASGISRTNAMGVQANLFKDLLATTVAANRAHGAIGQLTGGINIMNQATAAARATMLGAGQSFGIFTGSTLAVAAAFYGLAKAVSSSITVGAEFELTFARTTLLMADAQDVLKGLAGTASRSAQLIQTEIRRLAEETQFNLVETAEAASILARSGQDAGSIFANLGPVLDLAAIAAIDVAKAADIATGVMASFGGEAGALAGYVDILAYASTKSKASVEDLGLSMRYIGPIAANLGLNFEGTAAALGALSDVNIRGSMAGTALRRIFTNLLAPTEAAAAVMKKYGVEVEAGRMSTEDFIETLQKLSSASVSELRAISGQYAISSLVALTNDQTLDKLTRLSRELQNVAGYAEQIRGELRKTFSLTLENLVSTLQNVQQAAFEIFGPALTQKLGQLQDWVQKNGPALANLISNVVLGLTSIVEWTIRWGDVLISAAAGFAIYKTFTTVLWGMFDAYKALTTAALAFKAAQATSMIGGRGGGPAGSMAIFTGRAADDIKKSAAAIGSVGAASAGAAVGVARFGGAFGGVLAGGRGLVALLGGVPGAVITVGSLLAAFLIPSLMSTEEEVSVLADSLGSMTNSTEEAINAIRGMEGAKFDFYMAGVRESLEQTPKAIAQTKDLIAIEEQRLRSQQALQTELRKELVTLQQRLPRMEEEAKRYTATEGTVLRYSQALIRVDDLTAELKANEDAMAETRKKHLGLTGKLIDLNEILERDTAALEAGTIKQAEATQLLAANMSDLAEQLYNLYPAKEGLEGLLTIISAFGGVLGRGTGVQPGTGPLAAFIGEIKELASAGRELEAVQGVVAQIQSAMKLPEMSQFEDAQSRDAALVAIDALIKDIQSGAGQTADALKRMGKSSDEVVASLERNRAIIAGFTFNLGGDAGKDPFESLKKLLQEAEKSAGSLSATKTALEGISAATAQLGTAGGAKVLAEFGMSAEEAEKALTGLGEKRVFEYIQASLTALDPRFKDLIKTMGQTESAISDTEEAKEALRETIEDVNRVAPDFVRKMGGVKGLYDRLSPATEKLTSETGKLEKKLESMMEEAAKIQASLGVESLQILFEEFEQGGVALDEGQKAMLALVRANTLFGDSLKQALTPQQQFNEAQDILNRRVDAGKISQEQATRVLRDYVSTLSGSVEKLEQDTRAIEGRTQAILAGERALFIYDLAVKEFGGNIKLAGEEWTKAANDLYEASKASEAAEEFRKSWEQFYQDLAGAALEGTESVKSLFKRMLDDLKRQLLASGLQALMRGLFGGNVPGGFSFTSMLGNMMGGFAGGGSAGGGWTMGQGSGAGGFGAFGPSGGAWNPLFSAAGQSATGAAGFGQINPAMAWMAALGMGLHGLTNAGSGGASSAAAGLSYGALGWAGATTLYGAGLGFAANGLSGAALGAQGAATGAFGAGSLLPIVGWIAAIAGLVDIISGGKLFGTKFRPESSTSTLGLSEEGFSAGLSVREVRQRSLFRGRTWRTRDLEVDPEALDAAEQLFNSIQEVMTQSALQLQAEAPPMIDAAIRTVTEYDKKGKVKATKIFVDVLGRTWEEATAELAASRLTSEAVIATIDSAMGNTVEAMIQAAGDGFDRAGRPIREQITGAIEGMMPKDETLQTMGEASAIAERWRHDAELLAEGAQFLLAVATDIRSGFDLLGEGTLTPIVDLIEELSIAGETFSETYTRVAGSFRLLDQALDLMGIGLDRSQEEIVRFATEISDAAGGLDRASQLWNNYLERFYSPIERAGIALRGASENAQSQFADIGFDYRQFSGEGGAAQFRQIFEEIFPTLSGQAAVEWLEAAEALGLLLDAQAQYTDLLEQSAKPPRRSADLDAFMEDIYQQSADLNRQLRSMNMSPFERALQDIHDQTVRNVSVAREMGASEEELAAIRAFGTMQADELRIRTAQQLDELMEGLRFDEALLGMTEAEAAIAKLNLEWEKIIAQAIALGASEAELAEIRGYHQNALDRLTASQNQAAASTDSVTRAIQEYWQQLEENQNQALDSISQFRSDLAGVRQELVGSGLSDYEQQVARVNERFDEFVRRAAEINGNQAAQDVMARIRNQRRSLEDAKREYDRWQRFFNFGMESGDADLVERALRNMDGWASEIFRIEALIESLNAELQTLGLNAQDLAEIEELRAIALSQLREQLYEQERRWIEDLLGFRDSLLLDERVTTLTPMERLMEAERQYNEAFFGALSGDEESRQAFEQVARQYLEISRDYFGSTQGYTDIFNRVLDNIEALTGEMAISWFPSSSGDDDDQEPAESPEDEAMQALIVRTERLVELTELIVSSSQQIAENTEPNTLQERTNG